jgi:hypothetical protein
MRRADTGVAFLVRFAQMRLDRLRPQQWERLVADLKRFCLGMVSLGPQPRPSEVLQLQQDVNGLLEGVVGPMASRTKKELDADQYTGHQIVQLDGRPGFEFVVPPPHRRRARERPELVMVCDSWRDAVLLTAVRTLQRSPIPAVIRCPGCRAFLVRQHKRGFCGRRCYMKLYMRERRRAGGE